MAMVKKTRKISVGTHVGKARRDFPFIWGNVASIHRHPSFDKFAYLRKKACG
jgi:hypothetical protein